MAVGFRGNGGRQAGNSGPASRSDPRSSVAVKRCRRYPNSSCRALTTDPGLLHRGMIGLCP
ncbi:hypothetical protein GLA29479_1536 [Lysobacter antibioticus]|nr:hypothetical protein GLA29479_1536 [Lysobacter antibioticus]